MNPHQRPDYDPRGGGCNFFPMVKVEDIANCNRQIGELDLNGE